MPRYAKGVEGVDHYYQPEDLFEYVGEPFDVRITLLDENPEAGLWSTVEADRISSPIVDLLDEEVIGKDSEMTEFIRENKLDLDEFPHLSDALDRIAEVWQRYRESPEDAGLTLCVNHGADDIAVEDSAREHMSTCVWKNGDYDYMLLDLVLEPSEMTLAGMLGDRKREFELWLKGLLALYKLDIDPSAERRLRKRKELEDVREQLFFHNLVTKGAKGKLEITQQGRRSIGALMEEQQELIDRYDIYRDVVLRRKRGKPTKFEFATMSGVDYRVAVYQHEDIDPFRGVFLLTLLSGELDERLEGKEWLKLIDDEHFYEEILAPVVDHSVLKKDDLDQLVEQGEVHLARTAALRSRATYSEDVLERSKTIQAFPRPKKGKEKKDEGDEKEKMAAPKELPKRRRPFKKGASRGSSPPPAEKGARSSSPAAAEKAQSSPKAFSRAKKRDAELEEATEELDNFLTKKKKR